MLTNVREVEGVKYMTYRQLARGVLGTHRALQNDGHSRMTRRGAIQLSHCQSCAGSRWSVALTIFQLSDVWLGTIGYTVAGGMSLQ